MVILFHNIKDFLQSMHFEINIVIYWVRLFKLNILNQLFRIFLLTFIEHLSCAKLVFFCTLVMVFLDRSCFYHLIDDNSRFVWARRKASSWRVIILLVWLLYCKMQSATWMISVVAFWIFFCRFISHISDFLSLCLLGSRFLY